MLKTNGYAAYDAKSSLKSFQFERREPGPQDVHIEILYCGVCHTDVHQARDEWGGGVFPMVPGHEIVGRVLRVGGEVRRFKAGDMAGVGCMVDSCGRCPECRENLEQYCDHTVYTYNSPDKHTGKVTYGGYSNQIVVDQRYVLHISDQLDLAATAPLPCAGITTYSPLRHWQVGRGDKVGVVGLGGLGHMAVKFAHAFGAHVAVISKSPDQMNNRMMWSPIPL